MGLLISSQVCGGENEDFLRGEAIMEVAFVLDISRKRKVRLIWARKEAEMKGIDGG